MRRSLRARLIGFLLPPLAVIMVASAALQYYLSLRPARSAFDQALADTALALGQEITVTDGRILFSLSEETERLLRTTQDDDIFYTVRGPDGAWVAGDHGLRARELPSGVDQLRLSDGAFRDHKVRIAVVSVGCGGGRCLIEVAETTNKRDELTRDILLGTLLPQVALAALAFTAIWFGIANALRPLTRLSRDIERRSPRDLSPISTADAPAEAQPLANALNNLFLNLSESSLAQQRFLSTAAHQLRTPLAGLKAQTELALLEAHPPEMREKLDQLNQSAARASRLATQLLALARAEPETILVDPLATIDLRLAAQEQMDEWLRAAAAKQIDLGFELKPAPVNAQPILLRELMSNLVHNALEYTPERGQITLRCWRDTTHCYLEVEDNGVGIAPEQREKIFERFYRIPGTPGTGSGLGLAIVREIALAHDAKIAVLDPPLGTGTLLRVTFIAAD